MEEYFLANLVILPMISYDIILRMDWLVKHLATIDYTRKQVTLRPWGEGEVTCVGLRVKSLYYEVYVYSGVCLCGC